MAPKSKDSIEQAIPQSFGRGVEACHASVSKISADMTVSRLADGIALLLAFKAQHNVVATTLRVQLNHGYGIMGAKTILHCMPERKTI